MADESEVISKIPEPWLGRLKVAVLAALLSGSATIVLKVWDKVDVVNTALAQNQAKADSTIDRTNRLETRLEAIDAGTRLAVERLERKIDEADARRQRERDEDRALLQKVLAAVRGK